MNDKQHDKQRLIGLVAVVFGCFATYVILQYAIANLDTLGLPELIRKVRSYDIYLLVFVHVFLFFIGGVIAYSHPSLRFWLMLLAIGIFVYDFGGTFQARMGNVQQQTMTQSAQKDHAELLKGQISASQTATKELSDSAARQRANKLITGSAQTAAQAAKQADSGAKMVEEHAKTIANLHPTEADTWGEWTTQKMFAGALLVHLVNFAMWTLAGVMFGAEKAHAATIETPAPVHPVTPPTPDRNTFAGRAAAAGVVGGAALGGAGMAHAQDHSQMTIPAPSYWTQGSYGWTKWNPLNVSHAQDHSQMTTPSPQDHSQMTTPSPQEHSQMTTPDHSQMTTPKPKKARAKAAGEQMDTGTTGIAATRYNRIKQGVIDRKTRPSINALVNLQGEQIGDKRAREYLDAMVRDGVLVKNEATNRWEYAPQPVAVDPRQMDLVGGL